MKQLCGLLIAGRSDDSIIAGTRRSAQIHKLPLERHSAAEAHKRFSGFSFDEDTEILFDPGGGFLRVEKCVSAHVRQAIRMGAVVKTNEPVIAWRSDGDSVTVKTGANTYTAQTLVITAGAWTSKLLEDINLPLSVERVAYGWFPTANDAHRLESGAPVFGIQTPDGFPQIDDRGMKIADHAGKNLVPDPSNLNRDPTSADLERICAFNRQYMPGVHQTHSQHSVCMYTMTPDKHFIVDCHPEFPNVAFACGFSGHGFMFAPIIGSGLANLVTDKVANRSFDFLSLSRFGQT